MDNKDDKVGQKFADATNLYIYSVTQHLQNLCT